MRLLKAVRLPGWHNKIVTSSVPQTVGMGGFVLEPTWNNFSDEGVRVTEALVEMNQENHVKVLIENHNNCPVLLEEGTKLGFLEPVQVLNRAEVAKVLHLETDNLNENPMETATGSGTKSVESQRLQQLLEQLDVEWKSVGEEEDRELKNLLEEFNDVFALDPMEVGQTDLVQHHINTGEHAPVKQPPRRIPFSMRAKVEALVEEMLGNGIIEHSTSPWASPIVLVAKQDGSTRFCVDYRRLNAITKLDEFPLPRVDDSLDVLSGMKYFSTLDLATGYWQVGMFSDSKEKTAFITHEGLYEFSVMPFGLCNVPATFQRLMEVTLRGLARSKCVVYLLI